MTPKEAIKYINDQDKINTYTAKEYNTWTARQKIKINSILRLRKLELNDVITLLENRLPSTCEIPGSETDNSFFDAFSSDYWEDEYMNQLHQTLDGATNTKAQRIIDYCNLNRPNGRKIRNFQQDITPENTPEYYL